MQQKDLISNQSSQVSSLTSSPDSSPSPIAIALGQVSAANGGGSNGSSTNMSMGGMNGQNNNNNNGGSLSGSTCNGTGIGSGGGELISLVCSQRDAPMTIILIPVFIGTLTTHSSSEIKSKLTRISFSLAGSMPNQGSDSKMWYANSTTASPHSQSPKTFNFDSNPTSTADSGSVVETLR